MSSNTFDGHGEAESMPGVPGEAWGPVRRAELVDIPTLPVNGFGLSERSLPGGDGMYTGTEASSPCLGHGLGPGEGLDLPARRLPAYGSHRETQESVASKSECHMFSKFFVLDPGPGWKLESWWVQGRHASFACLIAFLCFVEGHFTCADSRGSQMQVAGMVVEIATLGPKTDWHTPLVRVRKQRDLFLP